MQELIKIFKALSDETRLKILKLLEKGELCVCEIVFFLQMSQPKVSFHLNILKDAKLVKIRKDSTRIFYSLNDENLFIRFLILSVLEKIKLEESFSKEKLEEVNFNVF